MYMRNTSKDLPSTIAASIDTREIDADRLIQYFDQLEFTKIPVREESEDVKERTWRVVLINLVTRQDPLALAIWDEITIGRRLGGPQVDLDLSSHSGLELGVSRVHASLRPTKESLMLHDMGSTNGTFCNATKATADDPVKVKDNDIIAFGALKFLVKVVQHPGFNERKGKRKKKENPPSPSD